MNGKMLSEVIRELQEIYNAEGDMPCVYSTDDEGNAYHTVYFDPSIKYWESLNGEVYSIDEIEDDKDGYYKVVCIN